ncbi:MAG TPA: hypothetical protein VE398_22915 [Acidobacteriota bacterium]|nr:hypothetical protein [Acidobacteriota bacterium]
MASDSIFTGLYPDLNRLRLWDGGFTKYKGLQVSLRGNQGHFWKLRDTNYTVSYALSRGESSGGVGRVEFIANVLNNHFPNDPITFGPNNLDYTHTLTANGMFTIPGGFRFNSIWNFRTAGAQPLYVPNMGGAISGANGFFGTDLNGDGGRGTSPQSDVLPGTTFGQFGRAVKSYQDLNNLITAFNQNYAGKLTPHGQALVSAGLFTEAQLRQLGAVIPTIPLCPTGNPNPFHNLLTTDVRFDRPINLSKIHEGVSLRPFLDVFNLFNHNPRALMGSSLNGRFGALNYDYSKAGNLSSHDLDANQGRIDGIGRHIQFGFRLIF